MLFAQAYVLRKKNKNVLFFSILYVLHIISSYAEREVNFFVQQRNTERSKKKKANEDFNKKDIFERERKNDNKIESSFLITCSKAKIKQQQQQPMCSFSST